jgi:glycosyltransferase involved in cell wall biosynthesis
MKLEPKFSIITVSFNSVVTIEQTILSVLNQTYSNIEYIIIDGGSTDGTVEIIKKHQAGISRWVSEPDKGIYDAMNKGIRLATGDWVGIINSDDYYELDAIEKVVIASRDNPSCEVFHGLLKNWYKGQLYYISGPSIHMLNIDSLAHPTAFVKKDIYMKYGVYNESYSIVADYELFLRFKNKNVQFILIESVLANFRIGGISTKSNMFLYEKYKIQYLYGIISPSKRVVLCIVLFLRNLIFKQ